ncbi:MAG: PAS domain S-box protein, partial [Gammaproteobacteria bacterium]|nr:PAS domain S-box protein [Gammaproteobacteria bacterium]
MTEHQSESTQHLREREARLGRILNSSSNEIYIFDASDLHFVEVNIGALRNLGYSPEELGQLTPIDLKPEFSRDEFERLLLPLRNGEVEYINFETEHQRKDGSVYPIDARLQLFSNEEPAVFVAIILDITEHKLAKQALHESEERFDLAMRGANDGLWDWDTVRKSVYFSPRWKEMVGYKEYEIEDSFDQWAELVHPEDLPAALEFIESYLNDPSI